MFDVQKWLRPHLKNVAPYSSARDEFSGTAMVFLDANENPYGSAVTQAYNRYPDPQQQAVKQQLAQLKGVKPEQIFLGNGSDEAIDLLFRAFANPGQDHVIVLPPTYGMYAVSAGINNVGLTTVPLGPGFQPDPEAILSQVNAHTRMMFFCSPNNPTGNLIVPELIEEVLQRFEGLVVVDEAYIDFANTPGWVPKLSQYPNLVVLQTFSKAWGLAALRLGMAYASPEIIAVLNHIKPPYNINAYTQQAALEALANQSKVQHMVQQTLAQRRHLETALQQVPAVQQVYPSQANFLLVKIQQARAVYQYLVQEGVIVRDRSKVTLCQDCLRITIGTEHENQILMQALQEWNAPQTLA